jgi:O-succinylbenzoate synthase
MMIDYLSFLFESRRYRLPFRVPMRAANRNWPEREGWVIRLQAEDGSVGWGEVAPIPEFGTERLEEAAEAVQAMGPSIAKAQIASIPEKLTCLRAGIGSAVSETLAVQPTSALPEFLPVAALLPAGRSVLSAAAPLAEAGFRVFKWKVGVADMGDELGFLDDLLAALPAGSKLRLDANGAWDRRRAERWLERCAERPIEFVEQPVAAGAPGAEDLLFGLAGDYPTPLALDESLVRSGDAQRWLGLGWPGIFVVKPSLFGESDRVLGQLAAAKARVVFSSALETAVGARSALRVAFAWPGTQLALGFGVWPLFADPKFDGPAAAPFIRRADVDRIDPEAVWSALR